MINDEMQTVTVLTYSNLRDEYGQIRKDIPTERNIDVFLKKHVQTPTADIRYNDIEYIALTKDLQVSDTDQLLIDGTKFNVLRTIESKRYRQLFLKKSAK